jgi:transcriptional regulator with XRE-family HTH domain
MSTGNHHKLFSILRKSPDYWLELASAEFTGELQRVLDAHEESGMSYTELAKRAGTSQPYISKVFSGAANFTLRTMIRLARAAGAVLHVRLTKSNEVVRVHKIEDLASADECSSEIKLNFSVIFVNGSKLSPTVGFHSDQIAVRHSEYAN